MLYFKRSLLNFMYLTQVIVLKAKKNIKITTVGIIIMKTLTFYRLVTIGSLTLPIELSIAKFRLLRLKYFPWLVPILRIWIEDLKCYPLL